MLLKKLNKSKNLNQKNHKHSLFKSTMRLRELISLKLLRRRKPLKKKSLLNGSKRRNSQSSKLRKTKESKKKTKPRKRSINKTIPKFRQKPIMKNSLDLEPNPSNNLNKTPETELKRERRDKK